MKLLPLAVERLGTPHKAVQVRAAPPLAFCRLRAFTRTATGAAILAYAARPGRRHACHHLHVLVSEGTTAPALMRPAHQMILGAGATKRSCGALTETPGIPLLSRFESKVPFPQAHAYKTVSELPGT